jgi:hypothetical protein
MRRIAIFAAALLLSGCSLETKLDGNTEAVSLALNVPIPMRPAPSAVTTMLTE